jgi:hypothetical protein
VSAHAEEPGIIGLPYSARQMFWISYSQPWCSVYNDESLYINILVKTARTAFVERSSAIELTHHPPPLTKLKRLITTYSTAFFIF